MTIHNTKPMSTNLRPECLLRNCVTSSTIGSTYSIIVSYMRKVLCFRNY